MSSILSSLFRDIAVSLFSFFPAKEVSDVGQRPGGLEVMPRDCITIRDARAHPPAKSSETRRVAAARNISQGTGGSVLVLAVGPCDVPAFHAQFLLDIGLRQHDFFIKLFLR